MVYYFSFRNYNPLISSMKRTNEALMLSVTRGFYAASVRHRTWQKTPSMLFDFNPDFLQIRLLTFLVQIS